MPEKKKRREKNNSISKEKRKGTETEKWEGGEDEREDARKMLSDRLEF